MQWQLMEEVLFWRKLDESQFPTTETTCVANWSAGSRLGKIKQVSIKVGCALRKGRFWTRDACPMTGIYIEP